LYFVYEWTNYWRLIALIAAVNESVWEHLKLGFWPAVVWGLIEYRFMSKNANNFLIAKASVLISIPAIIVIVFYSYAYFVGHSILAVDISTFVVAVIVGQLVSFKLLTIRPLPKFYTAIALAIIIILFINCFVMHRFI